MPSVLRNFYQIQQSTTTSKKDFDHDQLLTVGAAAQRLNKRVVLQAKSVLDFAQRAALKGETSTNNRTNLKSLERTALDHMQAKDSNAKKTLSIYQTQEGMHQKTKDMFQRLHQSKLTKRITIEKLKSVSRLSGEQINADINSTLVSAKKQ